ncbi:hypothetical protein BH10PSE5_BH10PSE5_04470 [soil metagenome]
MTNSLNLGRVSGLASLLMAALPMLAIAIVAVSTAFVAG